MSNKSHHAFLEWVRYNSNIGKARENHRLCYYMKTSKVPLKIKKITALYHFIMILIKKNKLTDNDRNKAKEILLKIKKGETYAAYENCI